MDHNMKLGPDYDPLPFILPHGPVHSRDTYQEWSRWRIARHDFVPAPRLSLAQHADLTEHRQMLYDLHRSATFANLPILETPMSAQLTEQIENTIKLGALDRSPSTREGVMVTGGGFNGKTETVCEIAASFEDFWRQLTALAAPRTGTRDLTIPVAYAQTPVTAKPKSTCEAILEFYGEYVPKSATLPQLMRAVRGCLKDNQTKILILDDITRLKLHRGDDQDSFDLIRGLMSMQVTVILIGVDIRTSGLLREAVYDPAANRWVFPPRRGDKSYNEQAATQHERRFNLLELDRFRYTADGGAAWTAHLAGLEERLCLLRAQPGMLTGGDMPEYLYRRTDGIVGLLNRLIKPACERAMARGRGTEAPETLSRSLLDSIAIKLDEVPGRDPDSGEIPHVPEHQPRSRGKGAAASKTGASRRRNGSFDDPGLAASSG